MTSRPDVIVIGGGAIGSACARELARGGRAVLILEHGGRIGEAWRASAGMLAPQIEARQDSATFEVGLAGRERYAALAGPLREATGIDIGLWQEGIARLATSEAEALEIRAMVAWQRQQGHLADWLDDDEVRARWPWLAPSFGALWAPREGAVDPERLVAAFLADAAAHGMRLVRDSVAGIERRGDRVVEVVGQSGTRYEADEVVVAAGAWSGRLEGLPRPLSVEPIRGQMAAMPWPADVSRTILYTRDCYLLPRGDEAWVGSTMEYAGFDVRVTEDGLDRIFRHVGRIAPAFRRDRVERTWAGLRPGTPDGLPIIGRAPATQNLWYATGHGRNGILLAALTGEVIRLLIDGERVGGGEAGLDALSAVSPGRFWHW